MIIDTSAWIEYSRGTSGPIGDAVEAALRAGTALTVDIVRLELLAGATDSGGEGALRHVSRLLASCDFVDQMPRVDVDIAAELFQLCRRRGQTVRSPNDCVIAAIAIRADVPVLHGDRDFDVLARHTALQTLDLS